MFPPPLTTGKSQLCLLRAEKVMVIEILISAPGVERYCIRLEFEVLNTV